MSQKNVLQGTLLQRTLFPLLYLHGGKLLALAAALLASIALMSYLGELKPWVDIDSIDIIGEGGTALIGCLWIVMILRSRPRGRVTNLLTLGLTLFVLAMFQDVLDEFFDLPKSVWIHDWLESGLAPLGVLILTAGIYCWHQEQLVIGEQLAKRERLFREHRSLDYITRLSDASYLRNVLTSELVRHRQNHRPLSLLMVDIANFQQFNLNFGYNDGDELLWVIAEMLLFNLRRNDLLCRYAADRFIILLPDTGIAAAEQLSQQLQHCIESLAYKAGANQLSYYPGIRIAAVESQADSSVSKLIATLKNALNWQKSASYYEAA